MDAPSSTTNAPASVDAGGRARAAKAVVDLLALAKSEGTDANQALSLVGWDQ